MTSVSTDRRYGINSGIAIKVPCKTATTANITLSGEQTIDTISCITGDRVLVKNQTDTTQNGIYRVDTSTWTRDVDFDGSYDVSQGTTVRVNQGNTNTGYWRVTTINPVIGSAIAFDHDLTNDAANIGYTPSGTGAVVTTIQTKLRELFSIEDFGAASTASAVVNTAAIHAAIAAANAMGGGIVRVPAKTYAISEVTFGTATNVILEGVSNGYDYGLGKTASAFSVTSGVWGVRLPPTGNYCGLRNIGLVSNGVVNTASPYTISILGTEYGVLIETGATIMDSVSVYGFQYGCVLACGGNSNIFDRCGFHWNTRVGFACTPGTAGGYALYHPNLTPPAAPYLLNTTIYSMRNCLMRRNCWGMILRDGSASYDNVLMESNVFGGLIEWVGATDSGVSGEFQNCYFENNWLSFTPTAITWATSCLSGNRLLLESAGVTIALVDGATNPTSDFGYQLTIGSSSAGTATGPAYQRFKFSSSLQASQKGVFIKQGFRTVFDRCSITGGDQTNLWRLGYATGGFLANRTHIYQFNGSTPADYSYSNLAMVVDLEGSATGGGLTASVGYFRGLAGNVRFPATQVPSADANTLDDYVEGTFTGTLTGCTTAPTNTFRYVKVGNIVTLVCNGGWNATSNAITKTITGLPAAITPVSTVGYIAVSVSDNGGANTFALALPNVDNTIILYKDASGNSWTASGAVNIKPMCFSYVL